MSLPTGTHLGTYEILAKLGAGGMGEVYEARDLRLGRTVALKLLPPELATDPERLARLEREARAVAVLNHPNIVTLYAVEDAAGTPFLVMERVGGHPLSECIPAAGFDLRRLVETALPVADALAAAHAKGIVHRDLKPSNVMLDEEGRVKVLDFGVAKSIGPTSGMDADTVTGTAQGVIVGTVPYMAPEQLRGEVADARSDLFSFGAMLYEMATGARPFTGTTNVDVAAAVLREHPPGVETVRPDLPTPLAQLITRCLEKNPADRVQSALELKQQLAEIQHSHPGSGMDLRSAAAPDPRSAVASDLRSAVASAPAPPLPSLRRRRVILLASLAVAVSLAFAFLAWSVMTGRLRVERSPSARASQIRSLAVLPFENLMHDPQQDYFVEGLHEALITNLARLGGLRVVSRASVMRYKGKDVTPAQIARDLGVDALVAGSVLRAGERVRVNAQLLPGQGVENLWADSYDRDVRDVLALLDDVSRAIAGEIRVKVESRNPIGQVKPEAYEAYLRGRQAVQQVGGNAGARLAVLQAISHFEEATRLDPTFAAAWSSLGNMHLWRAFFRLAPEQPELTTAQECWARALRLDPEEGTAIGGQAYLALYYDRDYEKVRRLIARGGALDSHSENPRHTYADYLMLAGNLDESVEQTRLGRDADPTNSMAHLIFLNHLLFARRYEDVVAEARRAIKALPQLAPTAHRVSGQALWNLGRYDEAMAEYKAAYGPDDVSFKAFEAVFARSGPQAALRSRAEFLLHQADAPGSSGSRAADRGADVAVALAEPSGVTPLSVASACAAAGMADCAFKWLDVAYQAKNVQILHVAVDPAYDPVRTDPRYGELMRKLALPIQPQ